jgi:hypothetical protein
MEGNYSWLDQSQAEWHLRWLQNVEKLRRELDWVRQGAKGRQTKQKARLQNDKMLNEDQKKTKN